MGPNSREVLTMDSNEMSGVSFGRKDGCFVSKSVIGLLLLVFACALIATGLLVFFFAGRPNEQGIEYAIRQSPRSQENQNTANMIPGSSRQMKSLPSKKVDIRLPTDLKPIHYLVKLTPFINGNFSVHGYVEFTFEVVKATSKIVLHINDIITKNDTVKVHSEASPNTQLTVTNQSFDKERQFYTATLKEKLVAGKRYIISMEYIGYLNSNLDGNYRSSYKDDKGVTRWLVATQFQPTDARKAFPCMDEPALKAKFTIQLERETNMSAISNMPLEMTKPVSGRPGWVLDKFQMSVPMSTYLVAYSISDFKFMESKLTSPKIRVYARESAISQANYTLKISPLMTKFFEDYFNIPFPLPKQDLIALPDFSAGAMENWGLIKFRETAMLYDPLVTSVGLKQWVALVVSHELAHQWFGNLVTPSWWTDLWLNEGFASYLEYLGMDAAEPSFKSIQGFVSSTLQPVLSLDCLESSHPISIEVKHPDEINEIFDKISYDKGSSIIRMMNHFLTENSFKKGLTNYLNKFAYDSAEQDDLWSYLTMQAHKDKTLAPDNTVKKIMDTWTLQMGFPVITATRKHNNMIHLKQERFLLIKNPNSTDKHDYKWWVPINNATQSNPDFTMTAPSHWMKPSEAEKTLPGIPAHGWFILNVQQTGYYRVNYEPENWNALILALKTKHTDIAEVNRAQLIDDSLSLSRAGLLEYETSLSILSYLDSENDYVPWSSALRNLGFIKKMFGNRGGYGSLQAFLVKLLTPIYNKLGFEDSMNSPFLDQRKRALVSSWMCSLEYEPCREAAVKLFEDWMKQPDNYTLISPNLKSFVYCAGVAEGGLEEWQFAWDRYINANVGSEKRTLLYALGCTNKPWILTGYLERGLSEDMGIRKQDLSTVIAAVARNRIGSSIAWEFIKNKWTDLLDYYGSVSFTLGKIIKSATANLNTENNLGELKLFRSTHSEKSKSAKRSIDQAVENTQNNLNWMNKNYDIIHNWLATNGYKNSV